MITVDNISKIHRAHVKLPGFKSSVRSLFKRQYIYKQALSNINLHVDEGEVVGLLGANGAGKTTLIKILSGVIYPTSGKVNILGHTPWKRETEFKRQIAVVMGQKSQLWWDLPASDCFLVLKGIYDIPTSIYRRQLYDLVERLGVGDLLKIQMRKLSLGERMKMELIGALLHQPRIIFLDEPTIGLDFQSQRTIREFFLHYCIEHRCAIILTSHYFEDVIHLCKRVAILREGRLVYEGLLANIDKITRSLKIITVRLDEAMKLDNMAVTLCDGNQLQPQKNGFHSIEVSPNNVVHMVDMLLSELKVVDLSIAEPDLSNSISAIMKGSIFK